MDDRKRHVGREARRERIKNVVVRVESERVACGTSSNYRHPQVSRSYGISRDLLSALQEGRQVEGSRLRAGGSIDAHQNSPVCAASGSTVDLVSVIRGGHGRLQDILLVGGDEQKTLV